MPEAEIADAVVSPGHDGEAELVVHVRYENGALGTVRLDASCAQRLLDLCGAQDLAGLRGQPWKHLLDVMQGAH